MPIREIKIVLGGNLQLAAIKGEERFVADSKIDEEVEVMTQERGIPLNEYLSTHREDRAEIYRDFRRTIRQIWQSGFIDLDVAFRNYLVRVDADGEPIRRNDRLDIRVHDFGCIFKLPAQFDAFLDERGSVAESREATITNGACLMRSLSGKLEVEFSPHLVPNAKWRELRRIFWDEENEMPLAKRLKHHSNYRVLRGAHQALVTAITRVVDS